MLKVLIADDEYYARLGIRTSVDWETYGFEIVAEAADAYEAYEKFMQTRPDIVITDICMEDTSGLDFIKKVRNEPEADVEFVVLTGYAKFEYAKQALELGVTSYVLKPVRNDELIEIMLDIKEKIEKKSSIITAANNFNANIPYLKNRFLLDILEGKCIQPSEIKEKFSLYNLCITKDYFAVAYIKFEQADGGDVLTDCIERCMIGYTENYATLCSVNDKAYALIIYSDEDDIEKLITIMRDILDDVASMSDNSAKVGLSDIFEKTEQLNLAYIQAKKAADYSDDEILSVHYNMVSEQNYRYEVKKAIQSIKNNYNMPLTVAQVAEEIYISPSHLMHVFKQETGKTFNKYLTDYRIEAAIKMLETHKYKVHEIAGLVGYQDTKYFGQIFKRYTGVSPSEYFGKNSGE